jgi:hypothetical protein
MDFPWRLKQRQADAHLRQFADECAEYVSSAHVGFTYETDPVAGTIKVRLQADAEPPLSLGTIIGDVLHNLRSALDAVAWDACHRAGTTTPKQQKQIYFPIDTDPTKWANTAKNKLPNVVSSHVQVFERVQPWFWDEEARKHGVTVNHSADSHPLARLHDLAKIDRHRVPHPVLARAGDTWIGTPEGVKVGVVPGDVWRAKPGDVVVTWRVDPPSAVAEVDPSGEAILALSDEAVQHRQSALSELQSMQQHVVQATRWIEMDVLGVVTAADRAELDLLSTAFREAEDAVRSLFESEHVIDADYIDKYKHATAAEDAARAAYMERSHELFD